MRKTLGIILIGLALAAVACGGGSGNEYPKQGVITSPPGTSGAALHSQVEDTGRICVTPSEYILSNPDGSRLYIDIGTKVEVLEIATCANDPHRPYKIRVIDQDIVGWVHPNYLEIIE